MVEAHLLIHPFLSLFLFSSGPVQLDTMIRCKQTAETEAENKGSSVKKIHHLDMYSLLLHYPKASRCHSLLSIPSVQLLFGV